VDLFNEIPLYVPVGDAEELTELVEHLCGMTRLAPFEARRVVEEVLAYLSESPAEFITRRHAELQRDGLANAEIFRQLASELDNRRFTAPPLSQRQIRRLVYG
jgi:hypothetical protein